MEVPKGGRRERARYTRYAKATFRKHRRLNIRLSSKDPEAIQKQTLAEVLPYQTLIASLRPKYAAERLKVGSSSCLPRHAGSTVVVAALASLRVLA
jgi:hypothetical protein